MVRKSLTSFMFLLAAACADKAPTVVTPDGLGHESHALASRGRGDLGPEVLADLAQVRKATARFHDLDAAFAAGYTVWSPDPFAPNATCPRCPDHRATTTPATQPTITTIAKITSKRHPSGGAAHHAACS